ncbi:MAG: hypothetical protein ACYDH5_10980 [Acidimicrobiales bacterium]
MLAGPSGKLVSNSTGTGLLDNQTTATAPTTPASSQGMAFQGPWGQAFNGNATAPAFFWSNVVNGTVYRIGPGLTPPDFNHDPITEIGAGFAHSGSNVSTDAGPQGLAYDAATGTLYVADTAANAVYAIPGAGSAAAPVTPVLVYQGGALSSPAGLAINPTNGDLLVVNGAVNNNLVEIDPATHSVVAVRDLAPNQPAGALFGLTATINAQGQLAIYYVNDNQSSLHLLTPPAGYRLAGADGGVFAFGNASYQGSLPGDHVMPAKGVVGIAPTATGKGYWMAGADGGVYAFGNAKYAGSLPGDHISPIAPIVGIAAAGSGNGYWLADGSGGVYAFGNAMYAGSLTGDHVMPAKPVVGVAASPNGQGYWLVGADGGVFAFGASMYQGAAVSYMPTAPVTAVAAQ